MYTLIRENVERTVVNEHDKNRLLMQGFTLAVSGVEIVNDSQNHHINLEDMTVEELRDYAEENDIDLGKATSQAGILEKIRSSLE